MRRKLVVKEPTLDRPTAKQTSVTVRSVLRRRAAARSRRRVSRYWWGASPKARRNARLKWAGESPAARARSATSSRSKYRASARSLARSRWRLGGTIGPQCALVRVGHGGCLGFTYGRVTRSCCGRGPPRRSRLRDDVLRRLLRVHLGPYA